MNCLPTTKSTDSSGLSKAMQNTWAVKDANGHEFADHLLSNQESRKPLPRSNRPHQLQLGYSNNRFWSESAEYIKLWSIVAVVDAHVILVPTTEIVLQRRMYSCTASQRFSLELLGRLLAVVGMLMAIPTPRRLARLTWHSGLAAPAHAKCDHRDVIPATTSATTSSNSLISNAFSFP